MIRLDIQLLKIEKEKQNEDIRKGYLEMAKDNKREKEATEWSEEFIRDIDFDENQKLSQ